MNNNSFISEKSYDICFDNTNNFNEMFDRTRIKNLEYMQENDELIQKLDIFKNRNENNDIKKNINQLKRNIQTLETELQLKTNIYEQLINKIEIKLDTETNEYVQLKNLITTL